MDSGVKHRLSNVIAWAGFVAAMVTLLYCMLYAYIRFAEIPAQESELAEAQGKLDALKQKFEILDNGLKLIPVELSAEIK